MVRLPASFTTLVPRHPRYHAHPRPMASSSGRQRSTAVEGPPATTHRRLASAASGVRRTARRGSPARAGVRFGQAPGKCRAHGAHAQCVAPLGRASRRLPMATCSSAASVGQHGDGHLGASALRPPGSPLGHLRLREARRVPGGGSRPSPRARRAPGCAPWATQFPVRERRFANHDCIRLVSW